MPSTTSESSRLIKGAISAEPAHLLKLAGFRKQGHRFYRHSSISTIHVDFQSSQWNTPTRASFTANLWAYLPAIAIADGEVPIDDPAKQRRAHAGMRIGHLMPQQQDHWWVVSSPSEVPSIASEVAAALREFGLPYLERVATLEGVAELSGLIPGVARDPTSAWATALSLLGRKAEAEAVLDALRLQQERARAYAERQRQGREPGA